MKNQKHPKPSDIAHLMGADALMVDHRSWQQFCAAGGFSLFDFDARDESPSDSVAVIPVVGLLVKSGPSYLRYWGITSYEAIKAEVQSALDDPSISGIVLDVDTIGGTVDGAFGAADFIDEAEKQKPIISVVNEKMFSAGVLLGAASTQILMGSRSARVGSVGIITTHLDASEAEKKAGFKITEIFAGKHKTDGSMHKPLSADAKQRIQGYVDESYDLFVTHVAKHRDLSEKEIRDQEAGIFMGKAGIANGLADAEGTLEDAIAMVFDLAAKRKAKASKSQTPSAAASAPVISTEEETVAMENNTTNPQPNADAGSQSANSGTAQVVNMDEIKASALKDAEASMQARLKDITGLCVIAKRPEKASEYMADGFTRDQVSEELQKLAALEDSETSTSSTRSNLGPDAQAKEAMALVDNMKTRCASMATAGKGI